ncbi:MAG: hypothetical protein WBM32_20075 [Crocosphaera sp.]|jgi:hypothetical protein
MKQSITSTQPINPVTPIDPNTIIKHGESPTAIILAIAILLIFIFSGITGLIKVILKQSK